MPEKVAAPRQPEREVDEIMSREVWEVKDRMHAEAERWLQPHAAHEVVRVTIGNAPTALFFHCLTCAKCVRVDVSMLHDYGDGQFSVQVHAGESALDTEQVENIRRLNATTQSRVI